MSRSTAYFIVAMGVLFMIVIVIVCVGFQREQSEIAKYTTTSDGRLTVERLTSGDRFPPTVWLVTVDDVEYVVVYNHRGAAITPHIAKEKSDDADTTED